MKRPRLRAALVVYGYRLAASLVVGYPVARAFGALGATALPDGDLGLFAPGGYRLMEALRLGARPLVASLEGGLVGAVVLGVGAVLPLSFALSLLAHPEQDAREAAATAIPRLSSTLLVSGLGLLSKALIVTLGLVLFGASSAAFASLRNEAWQDILPLGILAVAGVLSVLAGLVVDLGLVVAIRAHTPGLRALARAARLLRQDAKEVTLAYLRNAVGALLLVAVSAWLTGVLDVGKPGAHRVLAVFLVHQAAVLGIVLFRMSFFARMMPLAGALPASDAERLERALGDLP